MGDLIKAMLDKNFWSKKIPIWHLCIIGCIGYAGYRLNVLEASQVIIGRGVMKANASLDEHGNHLDRIDAALYYKFNIDTSPTPTGTPRQRGQGRNETTNATIAQIQNQIRPP